MPSDDYAAVGGGALKLKGGKVEKKKKKKRSDKTDLEKNISAKDDNKASPAAEDSGKAIEKRRKSPGEEAEGEEEDYERPAAQKTETELRHEAYKKKRLLDMAKSAGTRPELLKTHKERVEELNTYLSKLSEHHDMPKIGPG